MGVRSKYLQNVCMKWDLIMIMIIKEGGGVREWSSNDSNPHTSNIIFSLKHLTFKIIRVDL